MEKTFRHDRYQGNGIDLHYAQIGDNRAPLIVCLHGFPEFWIAWREVMRELADEFWLVAPDQRGFNRSFRPAGLEAYEAHHLVADITALAKHLSPEKPFVLAGHDWGSAVAYSFAFRYPERLTHLVIANGVHPACFQRAIFQDPGQRAASQYFGYLRAEGAEQKMSENNFARTLKMIEGFSKADWMDDAIRAEYKEAWSQPGAMTAMLNWYRASPVVVPPVDATAPHSTLLDIPDEALTVRVPHLVVWGETDEALRPACLNGLDRYASDLTIRNIDDASHWILHEKPREVADCIREFLAR